MPAHLCARLTPLRDAEASHFLHARASGSVYRWQDGSSARRIRFRSPDLYACVRTGQDYRT